jgi:predicted O-methyltransferase YrrM
VTSYTQDWFSQRVADWQRHVLPTLPSNPRWLEIGSYEGRSACWMLDNVPGVQVTCVDPFFGDYEKRFDENTRGRAEKVKSHSLAFLSKSVAERRAWHGCYIDGDHEGKSVLEDFVLAWHCVTVGGVIVLDDYPWQCPPHRAGQLPPGPAIDSCLSIYASRVELLHKAWQVIVRKVRE